LVDHENTDIRRSILSYFQDKPKKDLFKVYHFLFQKKYDLNSQEGFNKYKTFKSNLKFIESHNKLQNSYSLGITDFTDLTADEYSETFLKRITQEQKAEIKKFLNSQNESSSFNFDKYADDDDNLIKNSLNEKNESSFTQKKIDWTNKMNPVSAQGACGCCWAFSVIGAIEANYNIKFGNSPRFSQQQLVDCDSSNNGCNGGNELKALKYIKEKGIAFSNDYPYFAGEVAKSQTCVASSFTMNYIVDGFDYCYKEVCTKERHRGLLARGPIMVGIDGRMQIQDRSIFQHYTKGILDAPCANDNHAVILMGFDFDEKGEYLLARNSYGEGWGENGNFRIRTRDLDRTCFMGNTAVLPIVKQTFNPVPNPRPIKPNCIKFFSECNFKGEMKEICENVAVIENFPKISGYMFENNSSHAVLYDGYKCFGDEKYVRDSNSCLSNNDFEKNTKSIMINSTLPPSGCIWLYDNYCYSGNKVEICENVSDLNDKKYNFGNKASSYNYGLGIKSVRFFIDKNFQGNNFENNQGMSSFVDTWIDKNIESIQIVKS